MNEFKLLLATVFIFLPFAAMAQAAPNCACNCQYPFEQVPWSSSELEGCKPEPLLPNQSPSNTCATKYCICGLAFELDLEGTDEGPLPSCTGDQGFEGSCSSDAAPKDKPKYFPPQFWSVQNCQNACPESYCRRNSEREPDNDEFLIRCPKTPVGGACGGSCGIAKNKPRANGELDWSDKGSCKKP